MKVLITSGMGKVGREVTHLLLRQGHEPVLMTHSQEKMSQIPVGAQGVFGDFERPETWNNLFAGFQKLCLITPAMEDEGKKGCAFIEAAIAGGIQHIVLLSIHNSEVGAHLPHFQAKLEMEKVLKDSKIPYTFIRANNFYQNDGFFLNGVKEHGMYTQPIGSIGLSRVDVRDVAQAMVNALLDSRHQFRSYPLVGPDVITGEKAAKFYSTALGEKIIYPDNCLEVWETSFKTFLPAWLLAEWKPMYEMFIQKGLVASEDDLILVSQILENPARSYEAYVYELVGGVDKTQTDLFESGEFDDGEIRSP